MLNVLQNLQSAYDASNMYPSQPKYNTSLCEDMGDNLKDIDQDKPIICQSCHKDVQQYPSVGFTQVILAGDQGLVVVSWFLVCEKCFSALNVQANENVVYVGRIWPRCREEYKEGWRKFIGE